MNASLRFGFIVAIAVSALQISSYSYATKTAPVAIKQTHFEMQVQKAPQDSVIASR